MRQAVEPVHCLNRLKRKSREIGTDRVAEAASLQAFDVMFVSWRCCFLRWRGWLRTSLEAGMFWKGRSAVRSRDLGADPRVYLLFGNNSRRRVLVREVESSISMRKAFVTALCTRVCLTDV
jgi:hypothetical protein